MLPCITVLQKKKTMLPSSLPSSSPLHSLIPQLLSNGLLSPSPLSIKVNKKNSQKTISISVNNHGFCSCLPPSTTPLPTTTTTPIIKKRKRYRKECPGESRGIVEEMRFVAMKLRTSKSNSGGGATIAEDEASDGDTWQPSVDGFLRYLVDSKLVFETLDRIVEESNHVAYAYFRNTGLERSEGLSKDLEWFSEHNFAIPPPSSPGISYAQYLDEVGEKSAQSFLCHFYNIYFAHIAGGQVIGKQVSEKLLEGRELEFYKWDGDVPELLKDVRDKLNKLSEHWSRDEKNRCLREAAKSFKFSGQIVRLIIL